MILFAATLTVVTPSAEQMTKMLTLSACGHLTGSGETEPTRGAETFCAIAKPISWSPRDTDQTIREVKSHNATGVALCRWKAE